MSNVKEMRIFSAEQIIVQDEFPKILKDFTKEIVRKSPEDIIKFGHSYFKALLEERGYFEDHLDKLEEGAARLAGGGFAFKLNNEMVNDHYLIQGLIGDPYSSKARIGVHKQSFIERAIKQVDKATIDDPEDYLRKVEMIKTLDHPNIARYFEYFEDQNNFYFVSEYL